MIALDGANASGLVHMAAPVLTIACFLILLLLEYRGKRRAPLLWGFRLGALGGLCLLIGKRVQAGVIRDGFLVAELAFFFGALIALVYGAYLRRDGP